jgi:predicted Zn finger-like uncharacterized protein
MILTCPECSTRYVVDPVAIGPTGRTVRCTRCRHSWQEPPPPIEEIVAAPVQSEPLPPPIDYAGRARPKGTNLPAVSGERASRAPVILWTVLILFLVGVAGVAIWQRDRIIVRVPETAPVYEFFGLGAQPESFGLALENVRLKMSTADGVRVLRIDGVIVNISDKPRPVPQLLGLLLDVSGREIHRWTFSPPLPKLLHGERVPFSTEVKNPSRRASEVRVMFEDDRRKAGPQNPGANREKS